MQQPEIKIMRGSAGKSAVLFVAAIVAVVLLSGCVGQSAQQDAIDACKALCVSQLNAGADLSNGPCLSNSIAKEWVCDVAHSPRQAVDNDPANQCDAYRAGIASHFVEVGTSCELVRAV
jgi:hypothetical protein